MDDLTAPADGFPGHWIWPAECGETPNQYVEFQHQFNAASTEVSAALTISADSEYAVWINGHFVDCGQFPDFPSQRTKDRIDLTDFLQGGGNTLRVLVYYQGVDSFQYIKASPGLYYCIDVGDQQHVSGVQTRWRLAGYRQGDAPRITDQLGFVFEFDARCDEQWQAIKQTDLVHQAGDIAWRPRPVPKLVHGGRCPATIAAQGVLQHDRNAPRDNAAAMMQTDYLSARHAAEIFGSTASSLPHEQGVRVEINEHDADGFYLIIDLGREEVGFFDLDIDAPEGAVVNIANGEHLNDMRGRSKIGSRNFGHRYICRQGRQCFTHHTLRLAGRYLAMHFDRVQGPVTVFYAGLIPAMFPVPRTGSLSTSDLLDQAIYDTSVRTLELCMHEHYEDSPWREQALYANDARNQALAGYYAFGNYEFAANALTMLGRGLNEDGWLEMCAPARIDRTIPSFSLAWVLAVADHYLYAGDRAFARSAVEVAGAILDRCIAQRRDGLLSCPVGQRYWQFYDWAPGMTDADVQGWRFDAPLNLLLCMALDATAGLAEVDGQPGRASSYRRIADALRVAIDTCFWDPQRQAYRTYTGDGDADHYAELVQALAILSGTASPDKAATLRAGLMDANHGWVAATLSQSLYKFEALMTDRVQCGQWVFDKVRENWGEMLYRGATTFWETSLGAEDFDGAGSLCHGWSAIPAYLMLAYGVGIRPLEPGFKRFTVDPYPQLMATGLRATVPTPHGPIEVAWECPADAASLRVKSPSGTKACKKRKASVNNRADQSA